MQEQINYRKFFRFISRKMRILNGRRIRKMKNGKFNGWQKCWKKAIRFCLEERVIHVQEALHGTKEQLPYFVDLHEEDIMYV